MKMEFLFKMTINDTQHSLSPVNGIDMVALASIIASLGQVTNPGDGSHCILTGVSNHGYSPEFRTNSPLRYERYVQVHRHLAERGVSDLSRTELHYQRALKRALKGGLYIQAFDASNEPIAAIYPALMQDIVDGYYSIKTVYGVISEVGSIRIGSDTHIYLHEHDYKIFTTEEQDRELSRHYRSQKIALRVRQKISLSSGRVISATLISFKPMGRVMFPASLSVLTDEDLDDLKRNEDEDEDQPYKKLG